MSFIRFFGLLIRQCSDPTALVLSKDTLCPESWGVHKSGCRVRFSILFTRTVYELMVVIFCREGDPIKIRAETLTTQRQSEVRILDQACLEWRK